MSSILTRYDFAIESTNTNSAKTVIRKYLKPFFPTNKSSGSIRKIIKLNECIISVELPAELASFCREVTPWESCPRVSPIIKCITPTQNTVDIARDVAEAIITPSLPYTGVKIYCKELYPAELNPLEIGNNLDEIDLVLRKKNDNNEHHPHELDLNQIGFNINQIDLDSWFLKNAEFF